MDLVKVTVNGFKRFKESSHMYVGGKLIAIVGANEAGKSSFLDALVHWSNSEEFVKSGASQELSRDLYDSPNDVSEEKEIVVCDFVLNTEDKEALKNIPEAKIITRFTSKKCVNGTFINIIYPSVKRDISLRVKLYTTLDKLIKNKKLKFSDRLPNDVDSFNIGVFYDLIDDLETDNQTLEENTIEKLKEFSKLNFNNLIKEKDPKYVHLMPELIKEVILNEDREEPAVVAKEILSEHSPVFIKFDDNAKNLKSDYNLLEVTMQDGEAFSNLLETAEINLDKLKENIGDVGHIKTIVDEANDKLKKKFKSWKQSIVFPQIDVSNHMLNILIGDQNGEKSIYDMINNRSDGLRQYIALFTFINSIKSTNSKPIIPLIDEAETHLHYDAQADFIQMLAKQNLANKIIYTTHSMGCLPEDLGMGIRFIERIRNTNKSKINNWFWKDGEGGDKIGFSNILFGMGATTLAFVPLRNSLISEGQVDFILLPSLFREAIEEHTLGFQVAPGLSNASWEQLSVLDKESPKTVYITDSDHGMSKLHKALEKAGIDSNRIFCLPKTNKDLGLAIEDIILKNIYLKVLNKEIVKYNSDSDIQLKLDDIPENDRANAVDKFCKKNKIHPPSKREVAFGLLEEKANGEKILDKKYKTEISRIVFNIKKIFEEV